MAKYNIAQIQKMIERLAEIGKKKKKAILNMQFEDLEKMPNYTITDIKTLVSLRKARRKNKKALFLFLGEEIE